jgi:hypothetical protein
MPALKKDQAVSKLVEAIRDLRQDDILDVYNELFPDNPSDATSVNRDPGQFQMRIRNYIGQGLEVEEILDLWRVIFPKDRRVHFNEVTDELRYNEQNILYAE